MIIFAAKIGDITGSMLMVFTHKFYIWQLFGLETFLISCKMNTIYYFMKTIPASELIGSIQAAKRNIFHIIL